MRHRAGLLICALVAFGCKDKPTTGDLVISVNGLPPGALAVVRVTGPESYSQQVSTTTTLENLAPGTYTVTVGNARFANAIYASTVTQELHTIEAGRSEPVTIPYALASGSVNIAINGLPQNVPPTLVLTCPTCGTNGFTKLVSSSGIVSELPPGTYTLRADTLASTEGDRYGAANFRQSLAVAASLTPVDASVTYALISGTLAVTLNGVPSITPPPVTVTGPNNFRVAVSVSTTLRGLAEGTYTIAAVRANGVCPDIYTPQQTSQSTQVAIAATSNATVDFTKSQVDPAALNLKVDGMHLVQVVQDYAGTTPMVAGKKALLRVFGLANQCNTAMPKVRVTIGGVPTARTFDLTATESTVRTAIDQGVLISSYNVLLDPADVQPGLTIAAEIDPDLAVAEANEGDNRLPASGARLVDVRAVPSVGIRFIPITSNGLTGNVTPDRIDELLSLSRKIHPAFAYDAEVGATYTSGFAINNTGPTWGQVLNDLNAKRVADSINAGIQRYYVGIVKVNYNSGVAGIGHLPGKTTLSWDYPNSASSIIAHELGHNYERYHSPCGGPQGQDPSYPSSGLYLGGFIGQYGIDLADMSIKQPQFYSDIMGYCNLQWISDYNYFYMMDYLIKHPVSMPAISSAAVEPAVLIWGRIIDGRPVLEPAFEINARAELPNGSGPNRISAYDAGGAQLFSYAFTGDRIADVAGDQRDFAFAIPVSRLGGRSIASLRLTANGRATTTVASGDVSADSRTVMTRSGPRALRLTWDATRFPTVMVRDPASGEVLSFARGGDASIATASDRVELVYSNRVRSTRVVRELR